MDGLADLGVRAVSGAAFGTVFLPAADGICGASYVGGSLDGYAYGGARRCEFGIAGADGDEGTYNRVLCVFAHCFMVLLRG